MSSIRWTGNENVCMVGERVRPAHRCVCARRCIAGPTMRSLPRIVMFSFAFLRIATFGTMRSRPVMESNSVVKVTAKPSRAPEPHVRWPPRGAPSFLT